METWNSKHLSLAGRATLIKSVCSPILSFYMHCLPFPKIVCLSLDKFFRKFLWADGNGHMKCHFINWKTVSLPKDEGGLGIPLTFERNLSFLAKLFWRCIHNPSSMWACMCLYRLNLSSCSNTITGKALIMGKNIADLGRTCIPHSGDKTLFWFDKWCNMGPLRNTIIGPMHTRDFSLSVKDCVSPSGSWNFQSLSFVLPVQISRSVSSIFVNPSCGVEDAVVWGSNIDGTFDLHSAYKLACTSHGQVFDHASFSYRWIWKSPCHQRHKMFLWMVARDGLPCKTKLAQRNIVTDDCCVLCGRHPESTEHIFKDCDFTKLVWQSLSSTFQLLHETNFYTWLSKNCKCLSMGWLGITHSTLFIYSLWSIPKVLPFSHSCTFFSVSKSKEYGLRILFSIWYFQTPLTFNLYFCGLATSSLWEMET